MGIYWLLYLHLTTNILNMKVLVVLSLAVATLAAPQFAGLCGPSGCIGPSGIVGPSGPVQFQQPAWAFLGNHAHAHVAALNAHKAAHAAAAHRAAPVVPVAPSAPAPIPAHFQAAPAATVYGVDAAGCVVGPSGKVCPTGNIQFT